MKTLNALMLSALMAVSGLSTTAAYCAESSNSGSAPVAEVAVKSDKSAVKKLRGKLLYRRNQIRKLENAAMAADEALKSKVADLENSRREELCKAEPKLKELYALEKDLQGQIEAAKAK